MAYGVAMCGIGMLTLTGNTISMDVFGPVADNANGIGEMGYDRQEMGEENYKRARQILADLDAVGNTTKAETKGIAIGSAVIAAVSLFASFIAILAVGSEADIAKMTTAQYTTEAGNLSIAYPLVFVGALIGGVVPFLFSSMLIRAVGRAAFLIVKECRMQFRDKEIWAGTKKPDYGRVVNICTAAAQGELIGPALLAILMPILVGIFLGTQALGGYLAGMIIVGQLLAVFMANAGGAWDNAKKSIEDGIYGGKGSEAHKAAVTGDTVGDPLKDTAGPALNPLIKVMNMVSLLAIAPIILYRDSDLALPRRAGLHPGRRLGRLAEQDREQGVPRDGGRPRWFRRGQQDPRNRGGWRLKTRGGWPEHDLRPRWQAASLRQRPVCTPVNRQDASRSGVTAMCLIGSPGGVRRISHQNNLLVG